LFTVPVVVRNSGRHDDCGDGCLRIEPDGGPGDRTFSGSTSAENRGGATRQHRGVQAAGAGLGAADTAAGYGASGRRTGGAAGKI
jgi:hypothetical protein